MSKEINIQALLGRLRAVSETGCDPDLPHEAADAIAELHAERNALDKRVHLLEKNLIDAQDAGRRLAKQAYLAEAERDALDATLADLDGQDPACHQFQSRDGEWKSFIDHNHLLNTIEEGSWPIRELYARPVPAAQPVNAKLLEALKVVLNSIETTDCPWKSSSMHQMACSAIASAESAAAEPLIAPGANESVNQRLLEALRTNHQWHIDNDDYDGYPGSDLEVMNLAAIARAEAALTTTQPDAEVAK